MLEVKYFLGLGTKPFKGISLELRLIPGEVHTLPILSNDLNLFYELQGLLQIIRNLKRHKVTPDYSYKNNLIVIKNLQGIDTIQFLEPFKIVLVCVELPFRHLQN